MSYQDFLFKKNLAKKTYFVRFFCYLKLAINRLFFLEDRT